MAQAEGRSCGDAPLPGGCDFSRDALPALEERLSATAPVFAGLDECRGYDGGVYGFGEFNFNNNRTATGFPIIEGVSNCQSPNNANISFDANGDKQLGELRGFDDWDNLVYAFQAQSTFANGRADPIEQEPDAKVLDDARRHMSELIEPDLAVKKSGPADAAPGDTLDYELTVTNVDRGPAVDVTLADTKPDDTKASFDVGLLPVTASAKRTARFEVPCTARDGSVLTDTAAAAGADLYGAAERSLANNSDRLSTTVRAPLLTLDNTATAAVAAGAQITYRLTYENTGSGAASGVKITDTLPAGLYYSAALDGGSGPAPDSAVRHADADVDGRNRRRRLGAEGDRVHGAAEPAAPRRRGAPERREADVHERQRLRVRRRDGDAVGVDRGRRADARPADAELLAHPSGAVDERDPRPHPGDRRPLRRRRRLDPERPPQQC